MGKGLYDVEFLAAALLSTKTSWWRLLCAQVFGKRVESEDSDTKVIAHRYRGRLYVTGYIHR